METVFKIQYKDNISLSWKDIQKRYATRHEALDAGRRLKKGHDLRLVEITRTTRTFGV